ncbi:MAG: signal peptidase I [Alphaproteobacteria bacterium]|jgi:signal peptidase I|nr:signal peptidase I [Alphaproteobacteria bacterium]
MENCEKGPMSDIPSEKFEVGTKPMDATDKLDDMVRTIFIAALIAMSIRAFAFEPFNIPSGSMIPNLLVGDYLFVSKYSYGYSSLSSLFGLLPMEGRAFFTEPKRGDVIVFKLPRDTHTDYIKRLVGLPGDTIQVRDGLLYINGVAVTRSRLEGNVASEYEKPSGFDVDYIETFPEGGQHIVREEGDNRALDNTQVFRVPLGHYFAMGDNRDNSQDSRTPNVSFIPADNLVGRAEVIFFSLDKDSHFWQFWKWPTAIRWKRLFMKIK